MTCITEKNFHFWNLCLQTLPIRIGPSQYGCPICQNIQRTSWHAKRHISTHFNDRPFACQFCNYSTNRKDNLKFHMAKCNKIFKAERDFWITRISLKYFFFQIFWNRFSHFDFRHFQLKWDPIYLDAHFVNLHTREIGQWKDIFWDTLEKNPLVAIIAHILTAEKINWKNTLFQNTAYLLKLKFDFIEIEIHV